MLTTPSESNLSAAQKVLGAALHQWTQQQANSSKDPIRAFVTVSRQPGAGGNTFSHRLAAKLNEYGRDDWSAWDKELIEKVAREHHVSEKLIERLSEHRHDWLNDFLQSLFTSRMPPDVAEIRAYKKVMVTIRALATAGHAIIVGRGGQFITQGLPGGIHLRLIAPLEHRLRHMVEHERITLEKAAERIHEIDRARAQFYARYWNGKSTEPTVFTMTLNSAELSLDEMIECVLPLIRSRESERH